MKITCARNREQIAREQAAYGERRAAKQAKKDAQYNLWRKDYLAIANSVKEQVEDALSAFTTLNLEVNVDSSWRGDALQVSIGSNQHNVHDEHKALSWDWKAYVDSKTGELKKESGSWSGLNAVTAEQIESLKQSAACLEVINSLDWEAMLNVELPKYESYFTDDDYEKDPDDGRNFKQELLEADVEDAMNAGLWIKGHGYRWYNSSADVYYKVLKETPSQYEVIEAWASDVLKGEGDKTFSYKIKKDTFFQVIDTPVETLEVQ